MLKGILTTKLHKPAHRAGYVIRPRLAARLSQGLAQGRRLTLLTAPAGAGKSSLIAAWLMDRRLEAGDWRPEDPNWLSPATAWLALDADDNDPARFWTYAIAALQTIHATLGQAVIADLQSPQPPPLTILLPALLNDLAGLAEPVLLVLDDYHLIATPSIHESLAFVLDHAPPSLLLLIATRSDPPLPLARLRTLNQLTELRADDLRFTSDEAATFLNQSMGLALQPAEIDLLVGRTEGWPAGLQLAALALQGSTDPRTSIKSLSSSQHYVLDYLLEEVLRHLPETTQHFLTLTAILDRFCPELCDAVLTDEGGRMTDESFILLPSSVILDTIKRANPFLIALDNEQHWYCYHQLFRDLLRVRLDQMYPAAIPQLHRRAAAWLDAQELPAEALHHAFAAHDYLHAADLIERHIAARWALGDAALLSQISRLPIDLVQSRPNLAIRHAFALIIFGLHLSAENVLQGMLAQLPPEIPPELRAITSFAMLLLAYIAELRDEEVQLELPDVQSLYSLPEHRLGMRDAALATYAFLLHARGEFAQAEALLLATAAHDPAAQSLNALAMAVTRLGRIQIIQGRLHDAAALCRNAIDQIQARGQRRFSIGGSLSLILGDVLREWNDLEQAERVIRDGIRLNAAWPRPESQVLGTLLLARVLLARADLAGASAALQAADQAQRGQLISPDILSDLQSVRVQLWLAQGNLPAAAQWASQLDPHPPLAFRHERDQITRARVLLAQGALADAHAVLDRWRVAASAGGRQGRLIEIMLLNALALAALKRRPEALAELAACQALAEPTGYRRIFLDEEPRLAALLDLVGAEVRTPGPEARTPGPSAGPCAC